MKHVIIGTAGHVDHGKTLLIKALTGIDTDRLSEEKKRGITIELGFAHLDFDDGTQAGIIDVPGHEKFIKNMLAGAGGVDLAMLVVAADEGFMPQTIEHLGILSLLGLKEGLVVITKTDMVDPEWVDMVKEDVAAQVEGTFLEGKPVYAVSAYTGDGIPELRQALKELVHQASEKNLRAPFRLPIDRVFSVEGFGTVVTGTMIEGSLSVGETACVQPGGLEARVRNLQVHGRDVSTAYAGQRVAINLAGTKKSDLARGNTLAKPGSLRTSRMLDVRLQNLKNSQRTILTNSQVHLYHGSSVRLAKIILLDREALSPGESCYAQLRMSEELDAKRGDRFVIRFLSPLETIGGGVILDESPRKHRAGDRAALEGLSVRESGSGDEQLLHTLVSKGYSLPTAAELAVSMNADPAELEEQLQALCGDGRVLEPLPQRYLAGAIFDQLWSDCHAILERYHAANPLHAGMKEAELRQKLLKSTPQPVTDAILGCMTREGKVKHVAWRYALGDFTVRLTKRQSALREKILHTYHNFGLEVPNLEEVLEQFPPSDQAECKRVVESMVTGGELVMLTPQLCIHQEVYADVSQKTKAYLDEHGELLLSDFRDLLNTSRKYALALLEYYDKNKILKKEGDIRSLGAGFD